METEINHEIDDSDLYNSDAANVSEEEGLLEQTRSDFVFTVSANEGHL
jgi:hypothetical protein